jgi:hypothetical protein
LAELNVTGVTVRLIHPRSPDPIPGAISTLPHSRDGPERVLCPRVHFKQLNVDFQAAKIG